VLSFVISFLGDICLFFDLLATERYRRGRWPQNQHWLVCDPDQPQASH